MTDNFAYKTKCMLQAQKAKEYLESDLPKTFLASIHDGGFSFLITCSKEDLGEHLEKLYGMWDDVLSVRSRDLPRGREIIVYFQTEAPSEWEP